HLGTEECDSGEAHFLAGCHITGRIRVIVVANATHGVHPMNDDSDWLAERFEEHRPHLRAVAYRMLGSLAEADDAVQDAWLRIARSGAGGVDNLGGWLTTIVARVCLNVLRSRHVRREEPMGLHVPDPLISRDNGVDPEHEA